MEEITNVLSKLTTNDKWSANDDKKVIFLQSIIRSYAQRKKTLPIIFNRVIGYLKSNKIVLHKNHADGRLNSCHDENIIVKLLKKRFNIIIPNCRMWYDIILIDGDNKYPINIKTTTMNTSDNIGNFATVVWAYTNYDMTLESICTNGNMSTVFIDSILNKDYNKSNRDYYFLVINKDDTSDIIINSMRGLSTITPNMNNLPFQVKWKLNRDYVYINSEMRVKKYLCMIQNKYDWKTNFILEINKLNCNTTV